MSTVLDLWVGPAPAAGSLNNALRLDPMRAGHLRRWAEGEIGKRTAMARTTVEEAVRMGFYTLYEDLEGKQNQLWRIALRDPTMWNALAVRGYRHGLGRAYDDANAAKRAKAAMSAGDWQAFEKVKASHVDNALRERARLARVRWNELTLNAKKKAKASSRPYAVAVPQEVLDILDVLNLTDLDGVGVRASKKIAKVLADGMRSGASLDAMVADIGGIVTMTAARAKTIAVTELARAFSEGQLDMMQAQGVTKVACDVEFLTTGDKRVCFPAWTVVETSEGSVPIQSIRQGMLVKTRGGFKRVLAVSNRLHRGSLTEVAAGENFVVSTSDHLFWTNESGWVEAGGLLAGRHTVDTLTNQHVQVDAVVDLGFRDTDNSPTGTGQVPVFSGIPEFVSVPIVPIDFQSDLGLGYEKVNAILANISFLFKRYLGGLQGESDGFFNRGFSLESSVALKAAKPTDLPRADPECFFAGIARDALRRTAALFRAIFSGVAPSFVAAPVKELSAASQAINKCAALGLHPAWHGAVGVSGSDARFDLEFSSTSKAHFDYRTVPAGFIASARAEQSLVTRMVKKLYETHLASGLDLAGSEGTVALVAAKPVAACALDGLRVLCENLTASAAFKLKRHVFRLLTELLVFSYRWLGTPLVVYDLTVEGQPEFYANGILVHNCPKCATLSGRCFRIADARGLVPQHPSCLPGDSLILPRSRVTAASKRWYNGDLIVFRSASGRELGCTPNHPVLTNRGWVPARLLYVGSNVVCDGGCEWEPGFTEAYHEDVPASIHEVVEAFIDSGDVASTEVPIAAPDFHGDGFGSKVAVIGTDRQLRFANYSSRSKHALKRFFIDGDVAGVFTEASSDGSLYQLQDSYGPASGCFMRRCHSDSALPLVQGGPFESLGFGLTSSGHAGQLQHSADCSPGYAVLFGDHVFRGSGEVHFDDLFDRKVGGPAYGRVSSAKHSDHDLVGDAELPRQFSGSFAFPVFLDEIVSVQVERFFGHVYNLQTENGFYSAQGIITHNCRCAWVPA